MKEPSLASLGTSHGCHFEIDKVFSYSVGTESTALDPMVAETLKKLGFKVAKISKDPTPTYAIKFAENEKPVVGFLKEYNDDFNPHSDFAAILTCSQADEACPFIAGAEKRIPIAYEDRRFLTIRLNKKRNMKSEVCRLRRCCFSSSLKSADEDGERNG